MCPFHWNLRQSRVILESSGLESITQVRAYQAKVGQNHDARKAVSATLGVLKWSGAILRPRSSKGSVQKVLLCAFHWELKTSGVSLESLGLKNIPHVPGNRAEVGKNHHARKAVSASLSVLKWSFSIFRSRRSTVSVQKVLPCPFQCKPRQSGVSLEFPGLKNIP